jgi:uncharacterized membrane protein
MKYLIALLAVAGIVISSLAMRIHLMDPSAAPPCAVSEHWDCGTVNHSRYSWFPPKTMDEIFEPNPHAVHIPVAVIGIVGYTLIAIVALMGWLRVLVFLAGGGFLCAAYLSYIEKFVIQKWCIYCVWSQGIIAAILLASIVALVLGRRGRSTSVPQVLAQEVD